MSEYKTFSSNEYPKVGEVCMVLRTKILDESTGKVGPTESFFGKFSIEDGIPYWGAGHRCKPIDQWKLVEFEASPTSEAPQPPAQDASNNCASELNVESSQVCGDFKFVPNENGKWLVDFVNKAQAYPVFGSTMEEYSEAETEKMKQLWERSAPPADQAVWTSWSEEMEQREKRIKQLESVVDVQVEELTKCRTAFKQIEDKYKHVLEVLAIKDAKITKLQLENANLNARLNSNAEA